MRETQQDRQNEENAADLLRSQGWSVDMCPQYYRCDFFATDPLGCQYLVEYKRKKASIAAFPDFHLSAQKWADLRSMGRELGLFAQLIVEWDDYIGCLNMHIAHQPKVIFAGRCDRGVDERQPTVVIPLSWFQKLGK